MDLVKTRLQIQGELGSSLYSRNTQYRGFFSTFVGIIREEGLLRLWTGIAPAIARHSIYTGLRMGTYEHLRDNVLGKNPDGTFPLW